LHHPPAHARQRSQPDADTIMMAHLSQNLELTEQVVAHLLHLDADSPAPLTMEILMGDITSWLNETARDHEEQVRELFKYKHEFQRIVAEVSRADTLAGLEVRHAWVCG